jgi:hypothetical protein
VLIELVPFSRHVYIELYVATGVSDIHLGVGGHSIAVLMSSQGQLSLRCSKATWRWRKTPHGFADL